MTAVQHDHSYLSDHEQTVPLRENNIVDGLSEDKTSVASQTDLTVDEID